LLVAGALGILLVLPGIPAIPAFVLACGVLVVWWFARRAAAAEAAPVADEDASDGVAADKDDPYASLKIEPIEVHVGSHWVPLVNQSGSLFVERIATFRKQHAQEFGLVLPKVRFRESTKLSADKYEIHLDGVITARGEAKADRLLAIHPSGDLKAIPGEPTKDPTYGLPALWIEESQRSAAMAAKFTIVDSQTIFMTHLTEVLRRESARLLSRAETDRLLARVRENNASLVEDLIPTILSISDVQKVLQNLLREKVSIRHIEAILEALNDAGRGSKDTQYLTEAVRHRLGHAICQQLIGDATALHVMTLDPNIESQLMQNLRASDGTQSFVLEPKLAEQMVARLVQQAERMMKNNLLPVLLCSPELRRHVRTLSERVMPHLRVLAMTEIPQNVELKSYSVVTL